MCGLDTYSAIIFRIFTSRVCLCTTNPITCQPLAIKSKIIFVGSALTQWFVTKHVARGHKTIFIDATRTICRINLFAFAIRTQWMLSAIAFGRGAIKTGGRITGVGSTGATGWINGKTIGLFTRRNGKIGT